MRIFSNNPLSWSSLSYVYTVPRVSLNTWNNYHFYKIMSSNPIQIKHTSSIDILKTNYDYQCYWDLFEYKNDIKTTSSCEYKVQINSLANNFHSKYSNVLINYTPDNKYNYCNNYIYVPNALQDGDLIVVHTPFIETAYHKIKQQIPYRSHSSGNDIILS